MNKEDIQKELDRIRQQDQQTKNLINLIKNTDPKDLEQERFKNMSKQEKDLFK